MVRTKADVVIAGCGPIGSYLAWRLASNGLSVIGLEKKSAESAPSDIGVFHFERKAFDETGIPLPSQKEAVCIFPGMTIHAPDHDYLVRVHGVETWALDLPSFINERRREAEKAGADLQFGVHVLDVIRENGRVKGIVAKRNGKTAEYHANVVVDATGLAGVVRRRVPLFRFPGDDDALSVYMEYWKDPEDDIGDGIHSYLGPNAWTAKYPGYWIVGLGQPLSIEGTKAKHAAWAAENFPLAKMVQKSVMGAVPYAFPPPSLIDNGVVIIGDAAASNKPFNGEGIASGMALAKIVSEVLPQAIRRGADRASLWEINHRYFSDQGAKFAFIRAMGLALMHMTDEELNASVKIGLVNGEDLRQTFLDYEVKKPIAKWIAPMAKLMRNPRLAMKYADALQKSSRIARLFKAYPSERGFDPWQKRFVQWISREKRIFKKDP